MARSSFRLKRDLENVKELVPLKCSENTCGVGTVPGSYSQDLHKIFRFHAASLSLKTYVVRKWSGVGPVTEGMEEIVDY